MPFTFDETSQPLLIEVPLPPPRRRRNAFGDYFVDPAEFIVIMAEDATNDPRRGEGIAETWYALQDAIENNRYEVATKNDATHGTCLTCGHSTVRNDEYQGTQMVHDNGKEKER